LWLLAEAARRAGGRRGGDNSTYVKAQRAAFAGPNAAYPRAHDTDQQKEAIFYIGQDQPGPASRAKRAHSSAANGLKHDFA
jgi:hypothetical protein